jgi:hypothetical protein
LRGREGFGFLSARFGVFMEVKHLFSTTPEAKKQRRKKVTGVTGRWIGRGWHVRSVAGAVRRGTLGLCTGASGQAPEKL